MNQLSSTATVRAPLARVWETLADVGSIAEWHPGVKRSPVLSTHRSGLGASRRVELYDGSSAVEEVTSLEEGRSLTVTMSEHTMPLSHGAATFTVESDGEGHAGMGTRADFDRVCGGHRGWLWFRRHGRCHHHESLSRVHFFFRLFLASSVVLPSTDPSALYHL